MKLIQIALVLLLVFCSVELRKVHRYHHSRRSVGNNLWQLVLGALTSLAGSSGESLVQKCLPAKLQNAGTDESSATGELASSSTAWQIITKVGKVAIQLFCKFKSVVLDKILKLINRRRFFIMTRRGIRDAFKKVGRGIKNVAKKAVAGVKAVASALNPVAIVEKIISGVRTAIQKIKAFFASKTWATIKLVFECVRDAREAARNVVNVVKGFIEVIKKLAKGVPGIVEVLIDCICNYESFLKAIDLLIHAIKKNGVERVNYIGRFLGQLVVAISGN